MSLCGCWGKVIKTLSCEPGLPKRLVWLLQKQFFCSKRETVGYSACFPSCCRDWWGCCCPSQLLCRDKGGLQLQPFSIVFSKVFQGYFLKTPLTEMLLQLNLGAEPLKVPRMREKVPRSTKSISRSLSPVRHWWGAPWPCFGATGLQCGSRALMELCPEDRRSFTLEPVLSLSQ